MGSARIIKRRQLQHSTDSRDGAPNPTVRPQLQSTIRSMNARRAGDCIGAQHDAPIRHGGAVIRTPPRRGTGPTAMWPPPTLPRRGAAATARAMGMATGHPAPNAHHCRGFGGRHARPTGVRGRSRPQNRHSSHDGGAGAESPAKSVSAAHPAPAAR